MDVFYGKNGKRRVRLERATHNWSMKWTVEKRVKSDVEQTIAFEFGRIQTKYFTFFSAFRFVSDFVQGGDGSGGSR